MPPVPLTEFQQTALELLNAGVAMGALCAVLLAIIAAVVFVRSIW